MVNYSNNKAFIYNFYILLFDNNHKQTTNNLYTNHL